jgi:cyanophycinase-like exopeptidase
LFALCGGREARIAIVPTASAESAIPAGSTRPLFKKLGAREAKAVNIERRSDCDDE